MRTKPFLTRGLHVLMACALAALVLTTFVSRHARAAAPPRADEPPRPRKMDVVRLPFHEADESQSLSAPALSAPAILPWSKLTFQSLRNFNDWEIYGSNDDGTGQAQLTNHSADDIHPRFNRGATRVAFASERTGNYDIFTMSAEGHGPTPITTNTSDDVNPFWSPDGTKIAFQAYRDGQAEIYVMNADGSGQTRLTTSIDFDGQPAWSPDGSKIAFSSYRNGGYRIWVMNPDGSGQTQLSTQPYSFDPVWSPDGSQLAYDADSDGDGWQDLWRMNADCSGQQLLYDPYGTTDAWVRSWSPDGGYIALTHISFINYGGNWYWTNAYLHAWDLTSNYIVQLMANDTEWNPDWQTTDAVAPTSSVTALPAQSPGPFTVSWSGSDPGASGLKSYDVQIKEGAGGAWMDWQMGTTATSASYPGIGGHTYYFRSRARDNSFNVEAWPASHDAVTTVEALPPNAFVKPFPAFTRQGNNTLEWGGSDPGGSGIQTYDVQYRTVTTGEDWTDLIIGTTQTSTTSFPSTTGYTYAYRARATDNALNMEPWPPDGDTQTTFYYWGITGAVHDNTGAPVSGASVTVTPGTVSGTLASEADGRYAAYVLDVYTPPYLTQWAKGGYGTSAETAFADNMADAQLDVFLPPADNVMTNGEFESGDFGGWSPQGLVAPVVTSTVRHTGDYAALIGTDQLFTPAQIISGTTAESGAPLFGVDDNGAVHVVWLDEIYGNQNIFYARRESNGNWSSPLNLSNLTGAYELYFDLAVKADGAVHVIWTGTDYDVYYARRAANGVWSGAQNISQDPYNYFPQLAVDGTGTVHVVWQHNPLSGDNPEIYHVRRDGSGAWSSPQNISNNVGSSTYPQMRVDGAGVVHTIWNDNTPDYPYSTYNIFYARRDSGGTWSNPQNVSNSSLGISSPAFAVEANGIVHLTWTEYRYPDHEVRYSRRASGGAWSAPVPVARTPFSASGDLPQPHIETDATGAAHLLWHSPGSPGGVEAYYQQRSASGAWSSPLNLSNTGYAGNPQLAVSANGVVHVAWYDDSSNHALVYTRRGLNGAWSMSRDVINTWGVDGSQQILAEPATGGIHIVWSGIVVADNPGLHYSGPAPVGQADDSAIAQVFALPISLSTPTLSFLYQFGNFSGASDFKVVVNDGVASTTLFSTTAPAETWMHRSLDLSAWAGQTITLTFNAHEVAGQLPAWVYLDEVTLGSAYPDVWAAANGSAAGLPGSTVTYRLIYGNQGGAAANGTLLTYTLPAELTFVDASLPPLMTSPLSWEVGDLGAKSGSYTIVVTATVAPTATLFSTLISNISIGTASPELEAANNVNQFRTFIGALLYLPIIRR